MIPCYGRGGKEKDTQRCGDIFHTQRDKRACLHAEAAVSGAASTQPRCAVHDHVAAMAAGRFH